MYSIWLGLSFAHGFISAMSRLTKTNTAIKTMLRMEKYVHLESASALLPLNIHASK